MSAIVTDVPALPVPVILIVDDDNDLREMLRLFFKRAAYALIEAASGEAAVAACQVQRPDLILLDMMMPDMDGVTACEKIRALPGYAHLPILMVTALQSPDSITQAFQAGVTDYVTKPINPMVLRHRVDHLLRMAHAETRLRESEERYRLITDNMTDSVWLIDTDLRVLYVSPSAARLRGYSLDEIRNLPFAKQVTPASLQRVLARFSEVLTSDQRGEIAARMETFEVELYRKDGSTYWEEMTASLVRDAGGQIVNIVGVGRDITERRRAEVEVLQLNADLTQRARELAALNAAGRALTASLDVRQVLHTVVHEIQTLLDPERSAVLLRDAEYQELVFAAVAGEGSEILIGTRVPAGVGIAGWVMREGQAALVEDTAHDARFWEEPDSVTGYSTRSVVAVPIEFRGTCLGVAEAINRRSGSFTKRDQDMLVTLASSAAIAIENARLYQVEREQFQRLQESQARLIHAEKMSALGRLVASLTHEINNPLQAVQSGLYVMQAGLQDQLSRDELIDDVQIIESEVKRIANLMQRLREFSRPVQLDAQPTELHVLLDKLLELVGKQCQIQNIVVNKHWDKSLPRLQVNADQLTQVFMNLIINALDVMPTGGILTLSTRLDRVSDTPIAQIDVTDTGSGIEAAVLPHIFEPFFTTKPNGVGLGLAISYEIIQSSGGEVVAASQPGAGTTFSVRLPLLAG
jgi:PAS domain S-box-containing protein